METPIPIIDENLIELTKIVKFKGEYCESKTTLFLGDIKRVEGSARHDTGKACTKIILDGEYYFKVTEPYKKVKATWLAYLGWLRTQVNGPSSA